MNSFTETFFVALIGVIVSLVSFLVPLTYRFLRETAKEIGRWRAPNLNLREDEDVNLFVLQLEHYYVFADAITDIIAVSGAFSVLSIVLIMSKILVPQINPSCNIPFYHILNKAPVLPCAYLVFYSLIVLIALWDYFRYKKTVKEKDVTKCEKGIVSLCVCLGLAGLVVLPIWTYTKISELAIWVFAIYVLLIALTFSAACFTRPKPNNKKRTTPELLGPFGLCSFLMFVCGLFVIAIGASTHFLILDACSGDLRHYGVIVGNITLLVGLFLYWFAIGPLFQPNSALTKIYRVHEIRTGSQNTDIG